MKTILFTGWDEPYDELSRLTTGKMFAYARRHSMGFHTYENPPEGLNIYWTGVARGLRLLNEGCDRVMYLDVDQLITNPAVSFDDIPMSGFHCSKDWGADAVEPWHISACGFIAHQDSIPLFRQVLEAEFEYRGKPFQEQAPLREQIKSILIGTELLRKEGEEACVKIGLHPRRTFNAVPDEVCPGQVPEPWQPGDFAAHLTMAPMERRIELAKVYRSLPIKL